MAGSVRVKLTIDKASWQRMDRLLAMVAIEMRQKMVKKAVRRGAKVIEVAMKAKCPRPGYPGDKPGLKPLNETIGTVVREYGPRTTAIIGPQYPAGAHAHNVEFGHAAEDGSRVPPHPFARPAFDESKGTAQREIVRSLAEDVRAIRG